MDAALIMRRAAAKTAEQKFNPASSFSLRRQHFSIVRVLTVAWVMAERGHRTEITDRPSGLVELNNGYNFSLLQRNYGYL